MYIVRFLPVRNAGPGIEFNGPSCVFVTEGTGTVGRYTGWTRESFYLRVLVRGQVGQPDQARSVHKTTVGARENNTNQ